MRAMIIDLLTDAAILASAICAGLVAARDSLLRQWSPRGDDLAETRAKP